MGTTPGVAFFEAALALTGVPFRLHGRDPRGVDCVGLIALALTAIGRQPVVPVGYRLRSLSVGPLLQFAERNGFVSTSGPEAPGDVLLVHPCPIQAHLVIASGQGGFVHARGNSSGGDAGESLDIAMHLKRPFLNGQNHRREDGGSA